MIDSGFNKSVHFILIPTEEQTEHSTGMEELGEDWFIWVDSRLNLLSDVVHQFYTRIALTLVWLPFMAVILIPSLHDGYCEWQIRRASFGYVSPFVYRYAIKTCGFLIALLLMLFFAPFVLSPLLIPSMLMVITCLIGLAFSNLQKRV